MEKNTILAIALSIGVLITWNVLFPPPPPPESLPAETVQIQEEEEVVEATARTRGTSAETASTTATFVATQEVSEILPSKEVVVKTPNYQLTVDTRGGKMTNFLLQTYQSTKPRLTLSTWFPFLTGVLGSDYKEENGDNRVEMLGRMMESGEAFSVEFEGDEARTAKFAQTVYQSSAEHLYVDDEETQQLVLTSPAVEGLQIVKTFSFRSDSYVLDYQVQVINRSTDSLPLKVRHLFGENRPSGGSRFQEFGHKGPVYFFDGELESETPDEALQELQVRNADWFGLEDQYFIAAAAPLTPVRFGYFQSQPSATAVEHAHFGARLDLINLAPNRMVESGFQVYYGPKSDAELQKFGRQLVQAHDMTLEELAAPLLELLHWIYGYVGNYGVAIILLTVIVRIVLFPFTYKGMKSMKRMQQLAPRMKKLQEKYKNNKEKLNQEMMGLYKKNKVNPLGGCLPLLLQMPVFFALYSSLSSAVELRHAPFMFWVSDLSQPDGLGITPLIMGATMFIQQRMTPQSAMMDPTQAKLMQMLPLVFTVFTFTFPAGLTLYWMTSNILSIGQQVLINRIKTPEMQD